MLIQKITRDKLLLELCNMVKDLVTARELDVLGLWVAGYSCKSSAKILTVSRRTIEQHRANLRRKLQFLHKEALFNILEERGILIELFYFGRNCIY